jgi:hypothetical protein
MKTDRTRLKMSWGLRKNQRYHGLVVALAKGPPDWWVSNGDWIARREYVAGGVILDALCCKGGQDWSLTGKGVEQLQVAVRRVIERSLQVPADAVFFERGGPALWYPYAPNECIPVLLAGGGGAVKVVNSALLLPFVNCSSWQGSPRALGPLYCSNAAGELQGVVMPQRPDRQHEALLELVRDLGPLPVEATDAESAPRPVVGRADRLQQPGGAAGY